MVTFARCTPCAMKLATACKNVEELFAESFMFYAMGAKIPGHIEKLLERSLTIIKEHTPE